MELELHSHLPIEKQVRTIGVTWLDRQLVDGSAWTVTTGFGAAACQAVSDRVDFLVEQGLAEKGRPTLNAGGASLSGAGTD